MPQAARLGDLIGHTPPGDGPIGGGGGDQTGKIIGPCSGNVYTNGIKAARAHVDKTVCSKHDHAPPPIATGSATVFINGLPAARVGDKTVCSAFIISGSGNVFIGGPAEQTDDIESDGFFPPFLDDALEMAKSGAALVFGTEPEIGYSGLGQRTSAAGAAVALKSYPQRFMIGQQTFRFNAGTPEQRAQAVKDLQAIFKTKRGAEMLARLEARRTIFGNKKEFCIDLFPINSAQARIDSDSIQVDPKYHHQIETTAGRITMSTQRMFAHELGHAVMNAPVEHLRKEHRMININSNENPIMKELGEPERIKYETYH